MIIFYVIYDRFFHILDYTKMLSVLLTRCNSFVLQQSLVSILLLTTLT